LPNYTKLNYDEKKEKKTTKVYTIVQYIGVVKFYFIDNINKKEEKYSIFRGKKKFEKHLHVHMLLIFPKQHMNSEMFYLL
jgi:hypothetical protein